MRFLPFVDSMVAVVVAVADALASAEAIARAMAFLLVLVIMTCLGDYRDSEVDLPFDELPL